MNVIPIGRPVDSAEPRPTRFRATVRSVGVVASVVLTFHLICITWVFFRAETLADAWRFLARLLTLQPASTAGGAVSLTVADIITIAGPIACLLLFIDLPQYRKGDHLAVLRWRSFPKACVVAGILLWLLSFGGLERAPFVYFQF